MNKLKELYITNNCDDFEWEHSLEQLDEMFSDHVGRYAVVTSSNHGWSNSEVISGWEIKETKDPVKYHKIIDSIGTDSDWNMTIKRSSKNLYEVKFSDHDGVSDYKVKITNHDLEL
tara:strand:+ start:3851 stop:4198 length:348 start_codon:yes stop_codon:yes gene_type:complete